MNRDELPSHEIATVNYAGWVRPRAHGGPADATILRGLRWLITAIVLLPFTVGLLLLLASLLRGRDVLADLARNMM